MTNMKDSLKRISYLLPSIFIIVIPTVLVYSVSSHMVLYADDYYYATFTQNGASAFLRKCFDHYLTFNGRNLVHLVTWLLLSAGTVLFRYFNPLILLAAFAAASTAFITGERRAVDITAYIAFSMVSVTLIPIETLRESLFWISASSNYVFPAVLIAGMLALLTRDSRAECSNGRLSPFAIIFCIIAGATTEQYGAAAVFLCAAYAFLNRGSRALRRRFTIYAASAFGGLLTVIASPATIGRIAGENIASISPNALSFSERLFSSAVCYAGEGSGFVIVVLYIILTSLLPLFDGRLSRHFGFGWAMSALLTLMYILGRFSENRIFMLIAMLLGLAYISAVGIFHAGTDSYRSIGLAAQASVLTWVMMMATSSLFPRTTMPPLLLLIFASAGMFTRLMRHCPVISVSTLAAISLAGFAAFVPIIDGYSYNHRLYETNLESLTSGNLVYNIDYDDSCRHLMMHDDGYFNTTYRILFGIPSDAKINYISNRMPDIMINAVRLNYPARNVKGKVYFPIREVLESFGGSVDHTEDRTVLTLGSIVVYCNNRTFELYNDTGVLIPGGSGEADKALFLCFTPDVYQNIFGIQTHFDGSAYHMTRENRTSQVIR
ncbi:MAG: hypothetical protein GX628_06875 [Clostridiales bacterium]|nr:hypothetical protein [Clostridiales bacterium]